MHHKPKKKKNGDGEMFNVPAKKQTSCTRFIILSIYCVVKLNFFIKDFKISVAAMSTFWLETLLEIQEKAQTNKWLW